MKLIQQLLETLSKPIYHATSVKFKTFADRPAWFALNEKDAKAWYNNVNFDYGKAVSLKCKYTGGKIASITQWEKIAKEIWPDSDSLYSMFDERVREYPVEEVRQFIKQLEAAGFNAAYIDDYDPEDFSGGGGSDSLCVFHPNKHVKIEEPFRMSGFNEDMKHYSNANDFKVGEIITFNNSAVRPVTGKVVALVKQDAIIPSIPNPDNDLERYANTPAYRDALIVNVDDENQLVMLFPHQKIAKNIWD